MFDINEFETRMKKSISVYEEDLASIRAGRASASALNKITIDYYGTPTPISQVGDIKNPDARTLLVTPWDSSLLKAIEKAINTSDLGINPQNDGRCIRLIFPQLTQERRKELAKEVNKMVEQAKIPCRNARREVIDTFRDMKKNSEITEDDLARLEKDIQKMLDDTTAKIEALGANKEKEIMEI